MKEDTSLSLTRRAREGKSSSLARLIFDADVPEEVIQKIPVEALHLAIKANGLLSSAELLELATVEQCKLLLDFDLWEVDLFSESRMLEWLSVTDATGDLALLKKIVRTVDLKLVAILINRYVHILTFEEPTEHVPEEGFTTPDKGYTWIRVSAQDADTHFLITRLIAVIFELDPKVFYQLMGVPSVATESLLEEEAFIERSRRLSEIGVPNFDYAEELHRHLSPLQAKKLLQEAAIAPHLEDIESVPALAYDSTLPPPLASLFSQVKDLPLLEGELTVVANAALIFFRADFSTPSSYEHIIDCVKGVLSIGIDSALEQGNGTDLLTVYTHLGLRGLYQLGLFHLMQLRQKAIKIPLDALKRASSDSKAFSLAAGARERIPVLLITFLEEDSEQFSSSSEGEAPRFKPFQRLSEIRLAREALEKLVEEHLH